MPTDDPSGSQEMIQGGDGAAFWFIACPTRARRACRGNRASVVQREHSPEEVLKVPGESFLRFFERVEAVALSLASAGLSPASSA